ncbi:exodeoxyribonuclease V subunit gamma [Dichelobacter nodosus]|uniref:exodeoxyribonuclease V subunit gamma n=1 Tax=Dichelobacter nodosus TaxID=870 RepID=UPI000E29518E|nr:exodeoxyribonuclease V subunit gamma [Dichelobacter nodosus]AXM45166.1 exonuclease V subunit gamma [Dichelobacter nodosus]
MFRITQATDLAHLMPDFLTALHDYPDDIFAETEIVVPSMAIADYLEHHIAEKMGISCRHRYRFWGEMEWTIIERLSNRSAAQTPLSTTAIHWQLFSWLYAHRAEILADEDHVLAPLLHYLLAPSSARDEQTLPRLWQFSGEQAQLFTHYLKMRPDWLLTWQQKPDCHLEDIIATLPEMPTWLRQHYDGVFTVQKYLWQQLFAEAMEHRQQRIEQFYHRLSVDDALPALPARLFVFHPFSLTDHMLHWLQAFGQRCEVHLWLALVSNGYFPDIVDERWRQSHTNADEHFRSGHVLVSRFGKQQRDIFRLCQSHNLLEEIQHITPHSADTAQQSLLQRLQADMRALDDQSSLTAAPLVPNDDSIRIHGCHGLLRQLELLREELVRWLNADETRQLSDILIVLPELESVQDVIRTVFPASGDYDGAVLPARLTGIIDSSAQRLWQAISGIYVLATTPFNRHTFLQWVLQEEVCTAYGIADKAMQRTCDQLIAAGFYRGFEQQDLETVADGDARFTLSYALERLLSGLAMPQADIWLENIVPEHNIRNDDAAALAVLAQIHQQISTIRVQQKNHTTAQFWLDELRQRLEHDFSAFQTTAAWQLIAQTLTELTEKLQAHHQLTAAAADLYLPLPFILNYIGEQLSTRQVASEPSGVITIGRIGAMRALPYRLIAFVGADQEQFPHRIAEQRHNLLTIDAPRLGDYHREHDELGSFLHALSSAGSHFWCFYTAVDPNDHEERLPAAPVQELLDYLAQNGVDQYLHYHLRHQPNPFHREPYRTAPAPLWQKVQHHLQQSAPDVLPFLPESETFTVNQAEKTMLLSQIARDLLKPARTFLRAHKIDCSVTDVATDILEPLVFDAQSDGLKRWQIYQALLNDSPHFQYLPFLPAGAAGHHYHLLQNQRIEAQRAQLFECTGERENTPLQLKTVSFSNGQISADLPAAEVNKWVSLSARRYSVRSIFSEWLHYLLWCVQTGGGERWLSFAEKETSVVYRFLPLECETAERELKNWLAIWSRLDSILGMPLKIAWEIAVAQKEKNPEKVVEQWLNKEIYDDEKEYWQLLLRGQNSTELLLKRWHEYQPLFAFLVQHIEKIA